MLETMKRDKRLIVLAGLGLFTIITMFLGLVNESFLKVFVLSIVAFSLFTLYYLFSLINTSVGISKVPSEFINQSRKDFNEGKKFSGSVKFIAFPMIFVGLFFAGVTMVIMIIEVFK